MIEKVVEESVGYGTKTIKHWYLDDVHVYHTRHRFEGQHVVENINEGGVVTLSFNLKGSYRIHQQGHTYEVLPGQHNLVHTKGYPNTFENLEAEGESLSIEFTPERFYEMAKDGNQTLQTFLDCMQKDEAVVLSPRSLYLTPALKQALDSLLHCPYEGSMKQLFMLSKAIEVLVIQAETYHQTLSNGAKSRHTSHQAKQLEEARRYVEHHIQNPPTLTALAREVGLNEYTLKRGFKETFGKTVFGYLADVRLQRAQELLTHSTESVAAIALLLGYSSSQHFSTAFKQKMGVSPSQARNP